MSLADDLRTLHGAGRLRSMWLPGMLIRQHGIRFARLAWQDDTHWHASYEGESVRGGWLRLLPGDLLRTRNETEIVADDPATLGCLLALLREATGAVTWLQPHRVAPGSVTAWGVRALGRHVVGEGPTKADAIAAALHAVAQGVTRG